MSKKVLVSVGILWCLGIFFPKLAHAQQRPIKIQCNQKQCQMKPKDAQFFNATNIVPGQSFQQKFQVSNISSKQACHVVLQAEPRDQIQLARLLTTQIYSSGISYFGGTMGTQTLQDMFDQPIPVQLGILKPKAERDYIWQITFDSGIGNQAQALELLFSVAVNITCLPSNEIATLQTGQVLGARTNDSYFTATPINESQTSEKTFWLLITSTAPILFYFYIQKYR